MARRSQHYQDAKARAGAALAQVYRELEQKQADLHALWDYADQLAELEDHIAERAVRLQEAGISISEMSQTTGMHLNRIHRLIARQENLPEENERSP